MESTYLTVPSTRQQITDGTIVMLSRFPGMKWIVHFGWYTYDNQQFRGWYFNSIPANTQIPVTEKDLKTLTVVSGGGTSEGCNCHPDPNPHPSPQPPTPPGPGGQLLSPQQAFELNRSWISVDTIAMRDEISESRLLPDGKVVRVNRATEDNKPKYYIWNQVTEQWDDFVIQAELVNVDEQVREVAEEIVPEMVSKEIDEQLGDLDSAQQWQSWPTIEY